MAETLGEGVWWVLRFAMIIGVMIFITIIVGRFYSKQDIRAIEATAISARIIECITVNGVVDINKIEKAELLKCTNLNEKEIYVNVTVNSLESGLNKSAVLGIEMQVMCDAKERGIKSSLECLRQKFYMLLGNEKGKVDLLVGIQKLEANIY